MKKFLSLVLALAMTLSLVTISAGAKDFADSDELTGEQYEEAVNVMSEMGIIDGYASGDFQPQGTLTRGAAAKIIACMMLGKTTAEALGTQAAPFKDVPVGSTFAGYIAYCVEAGLIDGYADGTFRPGNTLTGFAFLKMLLTALGYDSSIEGFTGTNWTVNVASRAIEAGLTKGNEDFVGTKAATREEACLYAVNALRATLVEYENKGQEITVSDGTVINIRPSAPTYITSSIAGAATSIDDTKDNQAGDYTVEFGERYQPDLELKGSTDDFARPAHTWFWKDHEIGTYTETPDAVYTAKVESGEIYRDLGLADSIVRDDVTAYVDGEEVNNTDAIRRNSDDKIDNSANGVLTEVWYDSEDETVLITHVNTWVGTVVKTVDDDDATYVVVAPEDVAPAGFGGNEKFETNVSFEDDQYVLYTYSQDSGEIESVMAAEDASGLVESAENNATNDTDKAALTIDGTRYTASLKVAGEDLSDISDGEEYIVYLDSYGYIIYVERIDEIGDYALVLDTASRGQFVGNKAILVFTDGTSDVVDTDKNYCDGKVEDQIPDGTIVTYRVDEDGEYTLRAVDTAKASYVAATDELVLTNDKAGITANAFGRENAATQTVTANSATAFVVRDPSTAALDADEDWTAYTGIKNAPSIETVDRDGNHTVDNDEKAGVYYYCRTGRMVTVMFIVPGLEVEVEDGIQNNLFLSKESVSNLLHRADGDYFEYEAVDNNELVTVKIDENVTINGQPVPGATFNVSGAYTGCTTAGHNSCASYSEHVKATLGTANYSLFTGYDVDKYGVITNLEIFANYNENSDSVQAVKGVTGIDKVSREYTVILGTALDNDDNPATHSFTITCDEDATFYYVDEDGNITESSYNGVVIDDDDVAYAVVEDYMVQMLVIQEVDTKNDVQAPTTFTIAASDNNPVEGETVTLTSSIVLDNRRDEIVSYQWYKGGVAIAGADEDTYSFVAGDATDGTYTLRITVYNDRVNGVAEKTFTSTNSETVTSSEVVRSMDVLVTFMNGSSELYQYVYEVLNPDNDTYVDVNGADALAEATAEYATLNGYKVSGQSVKPVRFSTEGNSVSFQVTPKSNTTTLTVTREVGGTTVTPADEITIAAGASETFGYSLTNNGILKDVDVTSYSGSDVSLVTANFDSNGITIALDDSATAGQWYQIDVSCTAEDGTLATGLMFWVKVG